MSIKIMLNDDKSANVSGAVNALRAAYDSKDEEKISEAKEIAKATVDEKNRQLRREFYKKALADNPIDIGAAKADIIKAGYIDQIRLVDKFAPKKGHDVRVDDSRCAVNVLEVNRLVRKEVFSDDIEYICNKFRKAVVAYVASKMEKSADVLEDNLGYATTRWVCGTPQSMNNMRNLLQAVFDLIVFRPSDKDGTKNKYLAKKSYVETISYWVATKAANYTSKFASTEAVLAMVVDTMWAIMNDRELECRIDDITF